MSSKELALPKELLKNLCSGGEGSHEQQCYTSTRKGNTTHTLTADVPRGLGLFIACELDCELGRTGIMPELMVVVAMTQKQG